MGVFISHGAWPPVNITKVSKDYDDDNDDNLVKNKAQIVNQ
jgi:hypothetical protein